MMKRKWALAMLLVTLASDVACGTDEQHVDLLAERNATQQALSQRFMPDLGKGVNAFETDTFGQCVDFPALIVAPGFSERSYHEYSVQSRDELNKKLNVSAHMAARGLWGEARGEFSYFSGESMKNDSFYWVVDAQYELAHEIIATNSPKFRLTERAKQILATGGYTKFIQACGTHVYVGRTLGARYALLYEFTSQDRNMMDKMQASESASAFGISAGAEFSQAVEMANRSQRLQIRVDTSGGDENLRDKAESPAELKEELAKLRSALAKGRGKALHWEKLDYRFFPEVSAAIGDDFSEQEFKASERALGDLYARYSRNTVQLDNVKLLLGKSEGNLPTYVYSKKKLVDMRAIIETLTRQNTMIALRARNCLQGTLQRCSSSGIDEVQVDLPSPDRDFSDTGDRSLGTFLRRSSSYSIGLVAKRDGVYSTFDNDGLFSSNAGVFVVADGLDGQPRSIFIGWEDPVSLAGGTTVPAICRDEYADVCHLRVLESRDRIDEKGGARPVIVITLYSTSIIPEQDIVLYTDS